MKYLALLLATGSLLSAQQFASGQAARLVIGQPTFTRQLPGEVQESTNKTLAFQDRLGAVSGIAYANGSLFVVDSSRVAAFPQNNRILIYRDIRSQFPGPYDTISWDGSDRCPVCGGTPDIVLGQPDFRDTEWRLNREGVRTPTSVATDGRYLAVADTDNNRVLIWNSIPTFNSQPPDVVLGQQDFTTNAINFGQGSSVNERGLRGPQGVWIDQFGSLWVADTQNHRVLKWDGIPRENGAPANLVVGAPNFTTFVQVDLALSPVNATASNLLNPVAATVDPAGRLLITDLGHNRVLIWNTLPTQNGAPADFALGQPDVASTDERNAQNANNSTFLCAPTGQKDENGNDQYPALCAATLNFPRFALSDGNRLFIADGGNNRVLVYNSMPTANGTAADAVLGQWSEGLAQDSEGERISAADSLRTPIALAWDGTNLYVTDPFNRRVMVWTVGDQWLPNTGVRNAASREIYAVGAITFTSDPRADDEVIVTVGPEDNRREFRYKAGADQTIADVINALVEQINAGAGDPEVFASPNVVFNSILLTSRLAGAAGNEIEYSVTFSAGAQLSGAGGGRLTGGQDAAKIAPGTIVSIFGDNLASETVTAPEDANPLPTRLGGVEVYFDGIPAPLLFVSSNEIRAQMPWEVNDSTSVNAYVVSRDADGEARRTTAIAVPIIPENPGIFAVENVTDPRPALAYHGSSRAVGVVSIDGSAQAGNSLVVTIREDRNYGYTVKEGDTLETIRNSLVNEINADPEVEAVPSTVFTRILLRARADGTAGNGIPYRVSTNEGASVILTPLSPALCCANTEGAPITEENPALPGQLIRVFATGLGIVGPDDAKFSVATGWKYSGPESRPNAIIDAIAGGKTANVLFAGLAPGMVGVYEVILQLNSDIPTNPQTQLTLAQDIYVSNIVTFPVVNPQEQPEEEQQP